MKKRHISKIGFIFTILILSLASISISYSAWTDTITIQGTVNTMEDFTYPCLEGYWKFDETSGPIAYDSSANGYNGILKPDGTGPQWTSGQQVNGALYFDGTDDYVDMGNTLSLTNNFTIMVWVNPSSIGIDRQIISKGYDGTNTQWELKTSTNEGNVDFRKWTAGGPVGVRSSQTLTVDTWVHLAGTFDGTTWKIYWNGQLGSNSQTASGPVETPQNLYIGAVDNGGIGQPVQFWHGYIDEVKIYSCVLTPEQILAEYQADLL